MEWVDAMTLPPWNKDANSGGIDNVVDPGAAYNKQKNSVSQYKNKFTQS